MNVIEFWQTLSADAQFMDRKEVGSLSSPPLRASVWQCDPPAHLHSCAGPQRVLPSCEVQISILPLNLPLLISLFIPWLNISLVFSKTLWVLGGPELGELSSSVMQFCQSKVLCTCMNFACGLQHSQLFAKSQTPSPNVDRWYLQWPLLLTFTCWYSDDLCNFLLLCFF